MKDAANGVSIEYQQKWKRRRIQKKCEPVATLLTGRRIHRVTEQLKTRLFTSQDTSSNRSAVKTYAQTKVCRSRAKGKLEFIGKIMESDEAILCKSDHCESVVFLRNRKASGGDIYVGKGEKSEIDRFIRFGCKSEKTRRCTFGCRTSQEGI